VDKPVVLHVTPHLNGGLGRVLFSTLKHAKGEASKFSHEIFITDDKHLGQASLDQCAEYPDQIHIGKSDRFLKSKIDAADIVQIEFWNHPLIYRFLACTPMPPARVVVCCHVTGLSRPNVITENVVNFSDIFLATSRASSNHPLFQLDSGGGHAGKLCYVTYPVDFARFGTFRPKAHDGFNVGYIGTLDYSKLHRDFLRMCASVDVPGVKFIICGEDQDGTLEAEAQQYGAGNFEFKGFTEDVKSVLETLDVFGYPLNPAHFGSGEQAIIEAMYAGLPVVAFSNPPEKEIIADNHTGLLVDDERAYVQAIETLYRDPAERARIGRNAQSHIVRRLAPERCFADLDQVYEEAMSMKKKPRNFNMSVGGRKDSWRNLGARLFRAPRRIPYFSEVG